MSVIGRTCLNKKKGVVRRVYTELGIIEEFVSWSDTVLNTKGSYRATPTSKLISYSRFEAEPGCIWKHTWIYFYPRPIDYTATPTKYFFDDCQVGKAKLRCLPFWEETPIKIETDPGSLGGLLSGTTNNPPEETFPGLREPICSGIYARKKEVYAQLGVIVGEDEKMFAYPEDLGPVDSKGAQQFSLSLNQRETVVTVITPVALTPADGIDIEYHVSTLPGEGDRTVTDNGATISYTTSDMMVIYGKKYFYLNQAGEPKTHLKVDKLIIYYERDAWSVLTTFNDDKPAWGYEVREFETYSTYQKIITKFVYMTCDAVHAPTDREITETWLGSLDDRVGFFNNYLLHTTNGDNYKFWGTWHGLKKSDWIEGAGPLTYVQQWGNFGRTYLGIDQKPSDAYYLTKTTMTRKHFYNTECLASNMMKKWGEDVTIYKQFRITPICKAENGTEYVDFMGRKVVVPGKQEYAAYQPVDDFNSKSGAHDLMVSIPALKESIHDLVTELPGSELYKVFDHKTPKKSDGSFDENKMIWIMLGGQLHLYDSFKAIFGTIPPIELKGHHYLKTRVAEKKSIRYYELSNNLTSKLSVSKKINAIGGYDVSQSATTAGGLGKDYCHNLLTYSRATAGHGSVHVDKRIGIVFEEDVAEVLAERFRILYNEIMQFTIVLDLSEEANFLEEWGLGFGTDKGLADVYSGLFSPDFGPHQGMWGMNLGLVERKGIFINRIVENMQNNKVTITGLCRMTESATTPPI